MKTLVGTAVAFAGMTFGASYATANTAITGCECAILLRTGMPVIFTGASIEHLEITRTESTNVNSNCKVDLGSGAQMTWTFDNTGFTCLLDGVATQDWQEVISANGQTTLSCRIHP